MDFLLENEKSRLDELMKKVYAKNSFSPLKPLKTSNFSNKKNSPNPPGKNSKKVTKSLTKANRQYEIPSIPILIPKFLGTSTYKLKKDSVSLELKKPSTKSTLNPLPGLEISTKEKDMLIQKFPLINKTPASLNNRSKDNVNDSFRKDFQNFIAYIPSVSYINDNEDTLEAETVQANPRYKTFLQNPYSIRKSI
jgi:hypothetical protein